MDIRTLYQFLFVYLLYITILNLLQSFLCKSC